MDFNQLKTINQRPVYTHKPVDFDEIDAVEHGGRRIYKTPVGDLPSMTTVLGASADKSFLEEWRRRIGIDSANAEATRCADRGTAVHLMAEHYLQNKKDWDKNHNRFNRRLFNLIKPRLHRIDNIVAQEIPLYSKVLGIAGRVDLIAEYDGVLSVIDFKTSNKEKIDDWIRDYYIQCSGYSYMFESMYGIAIKQIVVIIACENSIQSQVFINDRINFRQELFTRIKAYHNEQC